MKEANFGIVLLVDVLIVYQGLFHLQAPRHVLNVPLIHIQALDHQCVFLVKKSIIHLLEVQSVQHAKLMNFGMT